MIRVANKHDAQLIKEIHRQNQKELGSFNLFYVWDKYCQRKANYKYLICDDCCFVRYGFSKAYNCNVVYEIGILKEAKGMGYGLKLMNAVQRPIILKCNIDNDTGNKFYEKIGMKKLGVVKSKNGKRLMNVWNY